MNESYLDTSKTLKPLLPEACWKPYLADINQTCAWLAASLNLKDKIDYYNLRRCVFTNMEIKP